MRTSVAILISIVVTVIHIHAQSWSAVIPNRAVYSLCADPQDPSVLYAGNIARTLFKTTDGGVTWEERAIGTQGGTSVIQMVAVHPNKSNIIFAAGQGMSGLDRSTDGGATWSTVLDTPDGFRCEFAGTTSVTFDPVHPDTMYAVRFAYGDVFRSIDAGNKWELISKLPGIQSSDNMRTISVCPDSSNVIIVSGRRSFIYRSQDYGNSWYVADTLSAHRDADVANVAWSPTAKGTIYATVQMTLFYNTNNAGLYKSTDYGLSWNMIALTDTSVSALLVNPTRYGDELLVGGCQFLYPADNGTIRGDSLVFRSVPGDDTLFSQISDVPWTANESGSVGYNTYAFAITKRDNLPVLLMASDGGVFASNNITHVSEIQPSKSPTHLVFTTDGFVIPESFQGACHYVVTNILGAGLQEGIALPGSAVHLGTDTPLLFVVVTDNTHTAYGMTMR